MQGILRILAAGRKFLIGDKKLQQNKSFQGECRAFSEFSPPGENFL